MAQFQKSVAQWAPYVDQELTAAGIPLPRDLILAVIHTESRGKPGLVNKKSGASGLTQVMPATLKWYNEAHAGNPVTLAELQSEDLSSAVKQIRVGIWVLSRFWRGAFQYLSSRVGSVAIDELAHIADLFYVAGPGATKKKLDKLADPTWAAVQAQFPTWNALPHPRNVFSHAGELAWPLESISSWLGTGDSILNGKPNPKEGFILAVLGVLVAWYLMRKGPKDGK